MKTEREKKINTKRQRIEKLNKRKEGENGRKENASKHWV